MFSTSGEELIRIAALQIMVEDLYVTGAFNPEISYRLTVLDGNINQRQVILNTVPIEKLLEKVPYFMILGFLIGSPELGLAVRGVFAPQFERRREESGWQKSYPHFSRSRPGR